MKSIMQEASSLSKAIEQGWVKAGQPQEFTVRILEEPQKNFFGFTVKSAKVALFFEDRKTTKIEPRQHEPRHEQRAQHPSVKQRRGKEEMRTKGAIVEQPTRLRFQTEQKEREAMVSESPQQQKQRQPLWTDEMTLAAKNWLTTTLRIMGQESTTFTIEPQRWHLRIILSNTLHKDEQKEKHLLASFATILLETLKRQFKTGLRGHKIVLTHASRNSGGR